MDPDTNPDTDLDPVRRALAEVCTVPVLLVHTAHQFVMSFIQVIC